MFIDSNHPNVGVDSIFVNTDLPHVKIGCAVWHFDQYSALASKYPI